MANYNDLEKLEILFELRSVNNGSKVLTGPAAIKHIEPNFDIVEFAEGLKKLEIKDTELSNFRNDIVEDAEGDPVGLKKSFEKHCASSQDSFENTLPQSIVAYSIIFSALLSYIYLGFSMPPSPVTTPSAQPSQVSPEQSKGNNR